MRYLPLVAILIAASSNVAAAQTPSATTEYSGICDASAAMPIAAGLFIVANDEDNSLRVYRSGEPNAAQTFPLDAFLKPDPEEPEADLEGATRIGDRIYWITSHGQNKNGKLRTSRHRLFATTVSVQNGKVSLSPVGAPYLDLRQDLIAAEQLGKYKLAAAAKLAPEASGGFNIEGLTATPDGRLLLGFRNPVPDGKSLVVPIDNPQDVLMGKKAKIGAPIELDLAARGIRSIEFSPERNSYLLVAGPFGDEGSFALYTWSGEAKADPVAIKNVDLRSLAPEAIFFEPGDKTHLHVISDDGGRKIGGKDCKKLDAAAQRFRATTLTIP